MRKRCRRLEPRAAVGAVRTVAGRPSRGTGPHQISGRRTISLLAARSALFGGQRASAVQGSALDLREQTSGSDADVP
jgi:hypothetical protein